MGGIIPQFAKLLNSIHAGRWCHIPGAANVRRPGLLADCVARWHEPTRDSGSRAWTLREPEERAAGPKARVNEGISRGWLGAGQKL